MIGTVYSLSSKSKTDISKKWKEKMASSMASNASIALFQSSLVASYSLVRVGEPGCL